MHMLMVRYLTRHQPPGVNMPRTRKPAPSNAPSLDEIQRQITALCPVAKGSLNHVRKPCVRPGCKACASGERHPVWLYTFKLDGRRRCVYVPEELVKDLQQALLRGRQLERLMCLAGEQLVRQAASDEPKA